jgi:hypothetical protein
MKWLFLVHQLHTPNSRERVKVWRAIKKKGAILYRNSVYILPHSKERLEDFQWVCQQINDSKGEASVFVSNAQNKKEDALIQKLFLKAREEEYAALLSSAERLRSRMHLASARKGVTDRLQKAFFKEAEQLRETFEEIRKIDFFLPSPPKRVLQTLNEIAKWFTSAEEQESMASPIRTYSAKQFQKKLWATREDIHIDRLCSAWLIRRSIDPAARFLFAPEGSLPKNAIPFDVFGAEFSHHGEDCTFETLIKAFRLRDPVLREIAEIIHDIDLKDHKFGRIEASGLDLVIRSLSASIPEDARRLQVGSIILDGLYRSFSKSFSGKRKK